MKELIKYIRTQAKMSQKQFAAVLGTQPLSINRWENGKTTPNRNAQRHIFQFCKEQGIQVFDKIVDEVSWRESWIQNMLITFDKTVEGNDDCATQFWNNPVLYHGSKEKIVGDIAPVSSESCDFGKGFYMGINPSQPLMLICNEKRPIIYTIMADLTELKVLPIPNWLDWIMLIAYYRGYLKEIEGTEFYNHYAHFTDGYDIIQGFIADNLAYRVMTAFFEKTITDTALINCLKALNPGGQYVALTEKACKNNRVLMERRLTPLELAIIKEESERSRAERTSLADNILLKYRRKGKYFDEIIKEGI